MRKDIQLRNRLKHIYSQLISLVIKLTENELYTTIVGLKNYEGNKVFKIGSIVRLVKEPDNDYDLESIACVKNILGKPIRTNCKFNNA